MPDARLLVALEHVSVEAAAGIPGMGSCQFRMLDDVSLTVREGELILVRGGTTHGGAALLRVLADDARVRTLRSGVRQCADDLLLRTGIIPRAAVGPIVNRWTRRSPYRAFRWALPSTRSPARQLYLLRAFDSGDGHDADMDAWLRWGENLQKAGGAAVLAEERPGLLTDDVFRRRHPSVSPLDGPLDRVFDRVLEASQHCSCRPPLVRIVQLGFGRVHGERTHSQRPCEFCREDRTALVS